MGMTVSAGRSPQRQRVRWDTVYHCVVFFVFYFCLFFSRLFYLIYFLEKLFGCCCCCCVVVAMHTTNATNANTFFTAAAAAASSSVAGGNTRLSDSLPMGWPPLRELTHDSSTSSRISAATMSPYKRWERYLIREERASLALLRYSWKGGWEG